MDIVFLIRTLGYGGAERQLVALATGLHARGHRVRVAVFYGGGPLERDLHAAGVPVLDLGKRGRWDLPRFVVRLARTLRSERPEVVHGYLGGANILALLTAPVHRGRVVWGVRASDIDMSREDWFSRLDTWVEAKLARLPALIIANSHAGKRHALASGYPETKTVVIPNGIDTARFRPDPAARAALRAELGVRDDEVLIGRIGRIAPQKDHPTFLRAAAAIARELQAARFVCVGGGPDAAVTELRALASELGIAHRVIWAGTRGDMAAVYNALDLCISSSAYGEGTPNVVAEAMACGVPCVVTDAGDCAITVGDAALVAPARDPEALARAALAALNRFDGAAPERDALRMRVVRELSMEQLVRRSEAALAAAASGTAPAVARLEARP